MKLNELRDNPGARKRRMRVGRGIGSGKGKTGGRGVKGQKSRTGVAINGFEGGQMPIFKRLPKRGFTNARFKTVWSEVNLGRLQKAIDAGRIDPGQPVTADVLLAANVISKTLDGVKLLAKGEIKTAVTIDVARASEAAVKAVEAAGGTVKTAAPAEPVAEG